MNAKKLPAAAIAVRIAYVFVRIINGGEDGIRTHVELPPNGFQDRPVMTASVPLHVVNLHHAFKTLEEAQHN